jgi:uncharacterized membrane protein
MEINYTNLAILLIIWCFLAYSARKWKAIVDNTNNALDKLTKNKTKDL